MPDASRNTIVLIANTSWYLWNFRRRLATKILDHGFRLVFIAPPDAYSVKLREISTFIPITLNRKGKNPITELVAIWRLTNILKFERPDVVLSWTPKLNIYCGLISRFSEFQLIPNVAGLGAVFMNDGWLKKLVGILYRLAFSRLSIVFFQNQDDMEVFVGAEWLNRQVVRLLPGSGVDLNRFRETPPRDNDLFLFLYGGRLLADKGLPELVNACRQLRAEGRSFVLRVYGHLDPGNPSGVSGDQIAAWREERILEYRGVSDCMEEAIRQVDCVVLPSFYREGMPRILLEAAASGRPAITTDSIGCREAVEDGVTGILCEPGDVPSLVLAMKRIMDLSSAERATMSRASRLLAETKFDENIVITAYMNAISPITPN